MADPEIDWKKMARKWERRAKRTAEMARRLAAEVRAPSAGGKARLAEIEAELDALYGEKRSIRTGTGEPFVRPAPADGSQEIITVPSTRKREGEVPPVIR